MKTAYELAMERLEKESPSSGKKLTDDQKQRLGQMDEECKSKIAERRIMFDKEIRDLQMQGKFDEVEKAREAFTDEIKKLEEDKETKKNKIRQE